ncbi:iron chelate uptake ABC transporter family permease subunit, partial [Streptomyces sp. Wh19]
MTAAGRAPRASGTGRAAPQIGLLVGGLLLLTVIAVLSMGVGARHVPPAEVVRALFDHQGTDDHVIVRDVRLPRALLAIAVGAALAVAGALIQTLARNPL